MPFKDTTKKYGSPSKLLHWGIAISIIAMFILGYWMRTLDYYSQWYQTAPHIHESMGLLLFFFIPIFLVWRAYNKNSDNSNLNKFERLAAGLMKKTLYILMFAILVLYLISNTPSIYILE